MPDENDWRLQGQERYLKGATLTWKTYVRFSDAWEHDHCEFCWSKFMEDDIPETLHAGYATANDERWVCQTCFADFADMFDWVVTNPDDAPVS